MSSPFAQRIAASLAALAIILGAAGAHGPLHDHILGFGEKRLDNFETAVFYHLIHAVSLYVLALCTPVPRWAFGLFVAGIVLFSGSLYCLATTDIGRFGAVTPFGGICLILGWIVLAVSPHREG